jgi:Family of unknown function (DUF5694)
MQMRNHRKVFVVAGVVVAALASMLVSADTRDAGGPAPGHAVEARLADDVSPRAQSEVMVLGTWHLTAFRDWLQPQQLETTLDALERYAPTRIAVERLPPDELALLAERAPHDPAAQRVIDQFARSILSAGQAAQQALGLERIAAERRASALLDGAGASLDAATRAELAVHLLAAYEIDSAALQWSYLSERERASATTVPADIRAALDTHLDRTDEVIRVAMPLARRLGLQRIHPVDSQYEAVRTLAFPEEVVDAVFGRANEASRRNPDLQRVLALGEQARMRDDLLALYLATNAHATQVDDASQWASWLTLDDEDGLARFRHAMWELRNQRMAAHVMDVAASTRPERVLFIVGLSHKAYVDRALAPHLGVRLVEFQDYVQ